MTSFSNGVQPTTLTERWVKAYFARAGGGVRVDTTLARAKQDGHPEPAVRAAIKTLGFVQFLEPGTNAPVWSEYLHCMAPDAGGKIAWATDTPLATRPQQPAAAAPAPTSVAPGKNGIKRAIGAERKSTMSYQTHAPRQSAPNYDANTLANRRLNIVMSDIAIGRVAFAEHLAAETTLSIAEARRALSDAPRNEIPGTASVASVLKSMGIVEPVAKSGSVLATERGETVEEVYARRRAECQASAGSNAPSARPPGADSAPETPNEVYERRTAEAAEVRRREEARLREQIGA